MISLSDLPPVVGDYVLHKTSDGEDTSDGLGFVGFVIVLAIRKFISIKYRGQDIRLKRLV